MDWPTKTVTSHTKRRLHEDFIDLIDDYSLKQLVDTPTRQGNILDLVLTNASEHCNECTTIPGISDHEAVRVTSEHCNECTTIPGISDHEAVRVTSEHCNECMYNYTGHLRS